jgi:hypothetical protein
VKKRKEKSKKKFKLLHAGRGKKWKKVGKNCKEVGGNGIMWKDLEGK